MLARWNDYLLTPNKLHDPGVSFEVRLASDQKCGTLVVVSVRERLSFFQTDVSHFWMVPNWQPGVEGRKRTEDSRSSNCEPPTKRQASDERACR